MPKNSVEKQQCQSVRNEEHSTHTEQTKNSLHTLLESHHNAIRISNRPKKFLMLQTIEKKKKMNCLGQRTCVEAAFAMTHHLQKV
jgi:hypothetical protein